MKDHLTYKGYLASVHYSNEDKVFFGKVEGVSDLISFEADNVKDLEKSFQEAVEDYVQTCKEQGKNPEKSYRGVFNVRVPKETHRSLSRLAVEYGINLNDLVKKSLDFTLANQQQVLKDL